MGQINKMGSLVLLFLLLVEPSGAAIVLSTGSGQGNGQQTQGQSVTTTGQSTTELVIPAGTGERVCWFNGQKYSKGARLKAGDEWIVCTNENDFETNGNLGWRSVSELKAIEAQQRSGVTIEVK